jgi:hypothetical protein
MHPRDLERHVLIGLGGVGGLVARLRAAAPPRRARRSCSSPMRPSPRLCWAPTTPGVDAVVSAREQRHVVPLVDKGYRYQDHFFNYPAPSWSATMPKFEAGDLLVVTTRPGHTDFRDSQNDSKDKKYSVATGHPLERAWWEVTGRVFSTMRRSQVVVQNELVPLLRAPAGREDAWSRADVYQNRRFAPIKRCYVVESSRARCMSTPKATPVFLVCDRIPGTEVLLMNAWGMDAEATHAWCYMLPRRFPHLLAVPRVVMAEIALPPALPRAPGTLSFAMAWDVASLLDFDPHAARAALAAAPPLTGPGGPHDPDAFVSGH